MSKPKSSKDALEFIHTLDSLAIKKQKDEIERLKAEVKRLSAADSYLQNANEYAYEKRCDELEAEVERLRKAGDDMASSIQFNEEMEKDYDGPTIVHPSVERWNAAKEGKQS